jgi:hypothetical protein
MYPSGFIMSDGLRPAIASRFHVYPSLPEPARTLGKVPEVFLKNPYVIQGWHTTPISFL